MVPILQVLVLVLLELPFWNLNMWAVNGLDCLTYLAVNGNNCHMCQPGYSKVGDCDKNGMPAQCVMCPNHTFQETCNQATTCAPCSEYCYMFDAVIVSKCNRTSNIICQCKEGFFLGNKGRDERCYQHRSCPPGYGVSKIGSKTEDTECEICMDGKNYSDVLSPVQPCQQCSSCPVSPVLSPCTRFNNTTCTAVLNQHGLSERDIGGIIGSVVGFIIFVAAVVGLILYCRNQQRRQRFLRAITDFCCNHARQKQFGNGQQQIELREVPQPVAIQGIPTAVIQVAPSADGQVAQPVANGIIYRGTEKIPVNGVHTEHPITEDQSDNERSTERDTVEDTGPIDDCDMRLHYRHLIPLSEMLDMSNDRNFSVSSNTELKQIVDDPRNFWQHEQPGAAGQDSLAVTPNNIGSMDQSEGPTESNTMAIPPEKTVQQILRYLARSIIKDFDMFFRDLGCSTAVESDGNMPNVDELIHQMHIDNKDNVIEANYQLLKKWAGWYGRADENFCITISIALRQCCANKILAELEERFRPYFSANGENHSTVRGEIQGTFSS